MWRGVLVLAVAVVAGCSTVSSYRVDGSDARVPGSNNAGSYFLAKHVLKVTVANEVISVASVPVADKSAMIQVGFNLSAFADDDIKIEYSTGGLLKEIGSINNDKTGEVLKEVAGGVGTFRNMPSALNGSVKVSEFTFDPFNAKEAQRVNQLLARAVGPGTCVSVEILQDVWSPGCALNPFQDGTAPGFAHPQGLDIKRVLGPVEPGIYYRRPLDHRVFVSRRGQSFETKLLKFANFAPVLRLDVTRTMFVKRETTIAFDDAGALTSVQVKKPSEALAIASLPAVLVGAYIDAIVKGFTRQKDVQLARAELYKQQAATLAEERKLLKAIAEGGVNAAGAARALSFRSGSPGLLSEAESGVSDLRQVYRNLEACQAELGASQEVCMQYMRALSANGQD